VTLLVFFGLLLNFKTSLLQSLSEGLLLVGQHFLELLFLKPNVVMIDSALHSCLTQLLFQHSNFVFVIFCGLGNLLDVFNLLWFVGTLYLCVLFKSFTEQFKLKLQLRRFFDQISRLLVGLPLFDAKVFAEFLLDPSQEAEELESFDLVVLQEALLVSGV
jgi:hypothetical protein